MAVGHSAYYEPGEEVLVFLGRSDRDNHLVTYGGWQGKWAIERSDENPEGRAEQGYYAGSLIGSPGEQEMVVSDSRLLQPLKAEIMAWGRLESRQLRERQPEIMEGPTAETLMDWVNSVIGVADTDDGFIADGEGRMPSIDPAWNPRWTDVLMGNTHPNVVHKRGDKSSYPDKGRAAARNGAESWNGFKASSWAVDARNGKFSKGKGCFKFQNTGKTLQAFGDKCNDAQNIGVILAIGYVAWLDVAGVQVEGEPLHANFHKVVHGGTITNSDDSSPGIQQIFKSASCNESVQRHENGHAKGFGHTNKKSIMKPVISNKCFAAPLPITRFDKRNGLRKYYPK